MLHKYVLLKLCEEKCSYKEFCGLSPLISDTAVPILGYTTFDHQKIHGYLEGAVKKSCYNFSNFF